MSDKMIELPKNGANSTILYVQMSFSLQALMVEISQTPFCQAILNKT